MVFVFRVEPGVNPQARSSELMGLWGFRLFGVCGVYGVSALVLRAHVAWVAFVKSS